MSLINEVLRNLDERNASAAERAGLAPQVRALPRARRIPWLLLTAVVAGAAAGAGGLWLMLGRPPAGAALPAHPEPAMIAAAPPPAEPPVAAVLPPLTVQLPVDSTPVAPAAPAVPQAVAAGEENGELRLDFSIRPPPARIAARPPAGPSTVSAAGSVTAPEPRSIGTPVLPGAVPAAAATREAAAAPAIDKKIPNRPGDAADIEYRKAMVAVRQGTIADAVVGLEAALRLDPRHVAARQALLSVWVEQGRWREAQALAIAGLTLDPGQTGWAMAAARLQLEQGQPADAEATMSRHQAYARQSADYQAFHGLLLQKLQRPRDAIARYQAALALRPGEGRWWYGLATALIQDQQAVEARAAFEKALAAGNLPPELTAAVEQRLR